MLTPTERVILENQCAIMAALVVSLAGYDTTLEVQELKNRLSSLKNAYGIVPDWAR